MPATEHAFSEFPPAQIYLDTDIIVAYMVATEPNHQRSRAFLDRMVETGVTEIYLSSLTWMEFSHVVTKQSFREQLPDDLRRTLNTQHWEDLLVRQNYLQTFLHWLERLLDHFTWSEIARTPDIRARAALVLAEYNLNAQDAVHLASATSVGVFDLASFDRIFRRVDGLNLWDDFIHRPG